MEKLHFAVEGTAPGQESVVWGCTFDDNTDISVEKQELVELFEAHDGYRWEVRLDLVVDHAAALLKQVQQLVEFDDDDEFVRALFAVFFQHVEDYSPGHLAAMLYFLFRSKKNLANVRAYVEQTMNCELTGAPDVFGHEDAAKVIEHAGTCYLGARNYERLCARVDIRHVLENAPHLVAGQFGDEYCVVVPRMKALA